MKIFILANSADPDEMPHHAAFHLGLHCLPMHLFAGIQNEKRFMIINLLMIMISNIIEI